MQNPNRTHQLYQLRIELEGTSPNIWRRLLVPCHLTLDQLHHVIQLVMGWQNAHLHVFKSIDACCFTEPAALQEGFENWFDETDVVLSDLLHSKAKTLTYEYDFGDTWIHRITLEKVLPLIGADDTDAMCLAGENACPPEDCGGIPGYHQLLETLKNPYSPEYEETLNWLGIDAFNPSAFDSEACNTRLQMMQRYSPLLIHDEIYYHFIDVQDELDQLLTSVSKHDPWQIQAIIDQFLIDSLEQEMASTGELPMSPEQLHQLLYTPFEANDVLQFNPQAASFDNAPILAIFKVLAEAAQHKGVKLTQRGNLPLKVTRQMMHAIPPELSYGQFVWERSIRSEEDVYPVHFTRILATLAGLCRIQKGTLLLTAKGRKVLEKNQWDLCFHDLIKATFMQFNWAYIDHYPELQMIRSVTWMMLFMLGKDNLEIPSSVSAEAIVALFPMLVHEVPPQEITLLTAEQLVIRAMSHRWLSILGLTGLITYQPQQQEQHAVEEYDIKLSRLGQQYLCWLVD